MRLIEHPVARTAFLVLTLSLLFAGDAWRMSLGWATFGVLCVLSAIASGAILRARRFDWRIVGLPLPLIAFLALATLSLAWSYYPGATALGLLTTWMITIAALALALCFTWEELLRGLSLTFKIVLGMSLAFELFVSTVIRAPILPLHTQPGVDYSVYDTLPNMLYWSRNEFFDVLHAGRIQGIVGNANNLGLIALLALIVFAIELVDRRARRGVTLFWIAIAVATLLCTRSATITVAFAGLLVVGIAVWRVRQASTVKIKRITYASLFVGLAAGASAVALADDWLLGLLGKSSDLTGRFGIWRDVMMLAVEHPTRGWGWVSYWVPWAEPFTNLTSLNGFRQLQAHNAWVDVFFQLGSVGIVMFAALVFSAAAGAWRIAIGALPQCAGRGEQFTALTLLPVLVMTVLVVQSFAESRLLVECGFALLVIVAVKTKTPDSVSMPARAARRGRDLAASG